MNCWRRNIRTATAPHRFPLSSFCPNTQRVFAALPKRGDVVVFRWPGDRSQVWVKRVIGLPGDRIGVRDGRVRINGTPVALKPDGVGEIGNRGRQHVAGRALHRDAAGRTRASDLQADRTRRARRHAGSRRCRRTICSSWATIATIPPTAACPSRAGGVGLLPVEDLVGRVDAVVGSWDLAVKSKPIMDWPSGLRLSRFFTGGTHDLRNRSWSASARRPKCSTACAAAA